MRPGLSSTTPYCCFIVVLPCSGTRKLVMVESIWPTFARAPMARQACRPYDRKNNDRKKKREGKGEGGRKGKGQN